MIRFLRALLVMVLTAAMAHRVVAATPSARLEDLAWLAGHWEGSGLDRALAHESWSPIAGGQMVGHFRQLKPDGSVLFYELITIVQRDTSLEMRIKHFDSDMKAWEEKINVVTFPLKHVVGTTWTFDGLTLQRNGRNRLKYWVRIQGNDGKTETLELDLRRGR